MSTAARDAASILAEVAGIETSVTAAIATANGAIREGNAKLASLIDELADLPLDTAEARKTLGSVIVHLGVDPCGRMVAARFGLATQELRILVREEKRTTAKAS